MHAKFTPTHPSPTARTMGHPYFWDRKGGAPGRELLKTQVPPLRSASVGMTIWAFVDPTLRKRREGWGTHISGIERMGHPAIPHGGAPDCLLR